VRALGTVAIDSPPKSLLLQQTTVVEQAVTGKSADIVAPMTDIGIRPATADDIPAMVAMPADGAAEHHWSTAAQAMSLRLGPAPARIARRPAAPINLEKSGTLFCGVARFLTS
jgi:hypothetical protein